MNELKEAIQTINRIGYAFTISDLYTRTREARIVFFRAMIVKILRKKKLSLNTIGALLNIDHSTVNYLEKHYIGGQAYKDEWPKALKKLHVKFYNLEKELLLEDLVERDEVI